MKMVKELEVLVIEENVVDGDVFCNVICKVAGVSMEVGMSKKDVIKVLVDNKVIKEENGKYVFLNFDNYDYYYDIDEWLNDDIYGVLGENISEIRCL
jgi:hypothetical protein